MTVARCPYGNLIFQHRRLLSQSGSMHEDEETSGLGTTAHKATVDKDKATVDKDKVESESLLPMERISNLEEGLKSLTLVVHKGFNRQEQWIRWIVGFGVWTVLFKVLYHDGYMQDKMLEAIKDSKNELEGKIKDSKNKLEDKFGHTLQLSLAVLKSDILLAIAKEEPKATKER
ncbi:hypothetical protein L873DRAFT_1819686 [Choiromyces venosus 120613-1]|uniref:Uncharacterized protein n=1 Tax=Choiromyces venosus 120613-1 TaxID=1336337 RepID=A0A3N4J297_9PEZI|nr:hypothetical protein L873DRAFT_1819686 [Choiromyces venosus 120613-1]